MKCENCDSDRVIDISAKCTDLCFYTYQEKEYDGYAPNIPGLCGDDYIDITLCLECGVFPGLEFPLKVKDIKKDQELV